MNPQNINIYLLVIIIIKRKPNAFPNGQIFFRGLKKKLHRIFVNILFHHFQYFVFLFTSKYFGARQDYYYFCYEFRFSSSCCVNILFVAFSLCCITIGSRCFFVLQNFHIKRKLMPTFYLRSIVNDCTFPSHRGQVGKKLLFKTES